MEIRYRTVAEIDQDHAKGLEWLKTVQGKSSPSITRNKQHLQDLRDAALAIKRMRPLDSATDDNPEPNPAKVEHWIAAPKDRENLYKHDIIKALANVNEGELRELVADMIVFNVGLVESGIENIAKHARKDGKVLMPDGRAFPVETLQWQFNTFGIRTALWFLLENNEWLLEHKQSKRRESGLGTKPIAEKLVHSEIKAGGWKPTNNASGFYRWLHSKHPGKTPSESTVRRYWKKYWQMLDDKK